MISKCSTRRHLPASCTITFPCGTGKPSIKWFCLLQLDLVIYHFLLLSLRRPEEYLLEKKGCLVSSLQKFNTWASEGLGISFSPSFISQIVEYLGVALPTRI